MSSNRKKGYKGRKRQGSFWKGLLVFLCVIGMVCLCNYLMNQRVYVSTYEVSDEKVPKSFDGYRLVQVTDIHSIRSKEQADYLYYKIVEENPDAIVLTGDIIDSEYYTQEKSDLESGISEKMPGQDTVDFVEKLTENFYVYYIYGNHEMVLLDDVDNNPFKVAMEEIGVIFLNNSGVEIEKDGESIYLLGLQDPSTLYKDKDYVGCETHTERINAMMQHVMGLKEKELFTVVLSHRPEYFKEYVKYDADLFLTGHAHGGQVRLPFVDGLYAPGQGFFPEYTSGLWEENHTAMIIGRGIGNAVQIPRVFNPPEIVTIVLKSE